MLGDHPSTGPCYSSIGISSHGASEQGTHEDTEGELGSRHLQVMIKNRSPSEGGKVRFSSSSSATRQIWASLGYVIHELFSPVPCEAEADGSPGIQ